MNIIDSLLTGILKPYEEKQSSKPEQETNWRTSLDVIAKRFVSTKKVMDDAKKLIGDKNSNKEKSLYPLLMEAAVKRGEKVDKGYDLELNNYQVEYHRKAGSNVSKETESILNSRGILLSCMTMQLDKDAIKQAYAQGKLTKEEYDRIFPDVWELRVKPI